MTKTLYEEVGGESKVRAIIDRLVERMTTDIMIGFFFRNTNRERLRELEFQHAAEFLGAPIAYRGRPMDVAHKRHGIAGGQFARRRHILNEVLEEHGVPAAIRDAWLQHTDAQRPLVTQDVDNACHGRLPEKP
jgi:truncated hemoglobin YjbI